MKEVERKAGDSRLLEAAFHSSSDGIAVYNPDGILLACNRAWDRAWEQLSGLRDYSEWVGKSSAERKKKLGYSGPEIISSVRSGAGPATAILINSNGDTLLTTATAHLDGSGHPEYIVMNVRNLTYLNYLRDRLHQDPCLFSEREQLLSDRVRSLLQAASLTELKIVSPAMRNIVQLAAQIAALDTTVLLAGETGTGKGLIARLIHRLSPRADKPFVEVNCGAIPEALVESELFGYQAGAFTGSARSGKKGQAQIAEGGTLFLDEISELALNSQVKLLKFLDDKTISPLGSTKPRRLDVRVLAATNKDLHRLVNEGKFRADLLFRLEVIPLVVPPLRERGEETCALAESFLLQFNREFGMERTLSGEVLSFLMNYEFPGNVRELKNLIARLVITAKSNTIGIRDLPEGLVANGDWMAGKELAGNAALAAADFSATETFKQRVEDVERRLLESYAQQCRSTHEIAKRMGIHHTSVIRKLKKHQIRLSRAGGQNGPQISSGKP
jgi:TyrR family helix-turn-helix protein